MSGSIYECKCFGKNDEQEYFMSKLRITALIVATGEMRVGWVSGCSRARIMCPLGIGESRYVANTVFLLTRRS